jgi:hypothetical protein
MSRQITGPTFPTVKLLGRRNHHDFVEFRFLKKTTVPAVLLATVVLYSSRGLLWFIGQEFYRNMKIIGSESISVPIEKEMPFDA